MKGILERIPPHLRKSLKNVAYGYLIWITLSIAGWIYLPVEWKWLAYGPFAFPILAIGITGGIIAIQTLSPKPIPFVFIRRKKITSCIICPMHVSKENPVSPAYPIIKCGETAKTCYNATAIQRWCPYVK